MRKRQQKHETTTKTLKKRRKPTTKVTQKQQQTTSNIGFLLHTVEQPRCKDRFALHGCSSCLGRQASTGSHWAKLFNGFCDFRLDCWTFLHRLSYLFILSLLPKREKPHVPLASLTGFGKDRSERPVPALTAESTEVLVRQALMAGRISSALNLFHELKDPSTGKICLLLVCHLSHLLIFLGVNVCCIPL